MSVKIGPIIFLIIFTLAHGISRSQMCWTNICCCRIEDEQNGRVKVVMDTNKIFSEDGEYYLTYKYNDVLIMDSALYANYLVYYFDIYKKNGTFLRTFRIKEPFFSLLYFLDDCLIIASKTDEFRPPDYFIIPYGRDSIIQIKSTHLDYIGKNDSKVFFKLFYDDTLNTALHLKSGDIISLSLNGLEPENKNIYKKIYEEIPPGIFSSKEGLFKMIIGYDGENLVFYKNSGIKQFIDNKKNIVPYIIALHDNKIMIPDNILGLPKPKLYCSSNKKMVFGGSYAVKKEAEDVFLDRMILLLNDNDFGIILSRDVLCKDQYNFMFVCRIVNNKYLIIKFLDKDCFRDAEHDDIILYNLETKEIIKDFDFVMY